MYTLRYVEDMVCVTLINKCIKKLFIFDFPYAIFISVYDTNLRTTTRTSRQNQLH